MFSEAFLRKNSKVKLSHPRGKVRTEDLEPQASWEDTCLGGHCSISHPVRAQPRGQVQLFPVPWTVARQTPLSMKFSRQEYWSEKPLPSPRDLPDPGIERQVSCITGRFFTTELPGKPTFHTPGGSFLTPPSLYTKLFSVIITFLDSSVLT